MNDPTRGGCLPCPKCGEKEAVIQLNLADLDTLFCTECEDEFTLDDVRQFIASWQAVLAWIDSAPAFGGSTHE